MASRPALGRSGRGLLATANIYMRIVAVRIRAQRQYPASFLIGALGNVSASLLDFLAIAVLFSHLPLFHGWSLEEVAFLYGVSGMAFGFCDLLVGHLDHIGTLIRTGNFDSMLIRPLGTMFQVASADFQLRRLGKILQAGSVLVWAAVGLDVSWTPGKLAFLVLTIACGTAIFTSVWIAGAALAFWTTETTELNNAFTYGGNYLTSYPLDIYGIWVRRFLAFAIPMAFVNYYPALYLLDRTDPLGAPSILRFLAPVAAGATGLFTTLFWRFAVRHYRSTGS